MSHKNSCQVHSHNDHDDSLLSELMCHFPYAIFSVAFGLIVLSLLEFLGLTRGAEGSTAKGMHMLFHSFHFLHLVFASTGALVMFSRYSNNIVKGLIVSLISALFFCTLSDIILPYAAGRFLGVSMRFHICLFSEMHNVVPFLGIGLLNGLVISKNNSVNKGLYSLSTHVGHILSSSLASLFYLVSEGFTHWYPQMGALFVMLVIAVVVPCTLADIIVPILVARSEKV